LYRGINDFKKEYQPRTNNEKDKKGDVVDCYSIVAEWRIHFSQLLNGSEINNLLFLFGIRRNCLKSGRSQTLYLFISKVIKQTVVIIEAYHFYPEHIKCYRKSCSQSYHMHRNFLGIISVDFDATGQLLIIYSAIVK
jgi:hypothetical protein